VPVVAAASASAAAVQWTRRGGRQPAWREGVAKNAPELPSPVRVTAHTPV